MSNNIIKEEEAIEGMLEGVKMAVDRLRPTYGSTGSNIVVESKLRPFHGIYNDAWSIIKAIEIIPENKREHAQKIGLDFVKEVCERADKLSGDSRKTTLILLDEILTAGFESKIDKLQLKKELDALIPLLESEIDKQTRTITVNEVESVATTAGESVDIGRLLQEIYQKIGQSGNIQVEGSGTPLTSYRLVDGVRFDMAGYLSGDFADPKTKKVVYEDPLILVTKKKISTDDDINPLLLELQGIAEKRPLVIFTQDMDGYIASSLVNLHKSGMQQVCIIAAPSLWQDFYFEDFAKCTGATIIEDSTGKSFKNLLLEDLGTCDKITISADETVINGHKDITEHINYLESIGDDDSKLRLSWLNSKTALLKLGAGSETDLSYKLKKCNDAIKSSELALKYGVVDGGGLCLDRVANNLPLGTEVANVLLFALKAPRQQIITNSNTEEVKENITDASMVVKMAVKNAVGLASTILTSSALVYIPNEQKVKQNDPFL